jgi:hypothetical protein
MLALRADSPAQPWAVADYADNKSSAPTFYFAEA